MKNQIKNYGLKFSIIKDERAYVFGAISSVPKVMLRPTGDWTDLPDKEIQNRKFETYNCTAFNTLAQIEKLVYVVTGEKVNYSDRFLGVVAGTKPPGNDPHVVAEAIRKYGCIPEEMMPFSDDLKNVDEYYSWKGVDKEKCLAEGQKWLERINFMHEWVFSYFDTDDVKKRKLLETLTYSPIAAGVYAWEKSGDVYISSGEANHWTGNVLGIAQKKWVANDTYIDTDGDTLKDLAWDFNFVSPKRYFIELRTVTEKRKSIIWETIMKLLQLIGLMQKEGIIELPKPEEPKPTLQIDKLTQFCTAIRDFEGGPGDRNYRNNNPGNCKYSPVGYKPIYGEVKRDNKNFAIFKDYETGWLYLKNFVKAKVKENPNQTLFQFIANIYAPESDNNSPVNYSNFLAQRMGVTVSTKMKDII